MSPDQFYPLVVAAGVLGLGVILFFGDWF